jgi:two-component system, NarL family, sensor kinase
LAPVIAIEPTYYNFIQPGAKPYFPMLPLLTSHKKPVLFFILLMISSSLFSQRNVVDTFESRLQKEPNDSARLIKAILLAKYFDNIDSATAWKYFHIGRQIAEKANTHFAKIQILELEGVLNTRNNPARAYVLYQQAIGLCQEMKKDSTTKRYEASLLNNLGVISYLNGDYEGASQSFTESVKIYEEFDVSNYNLPLTLNNISSTYDALDYPSKAIQYSQESAKYAEKYGNAKLKATGYIGVASNLITLNQLDSVRIIIRRALEMTKLSGDQYDLYLCYTNLGRYFEKRDHNDSALFYYKKALPLSQAIQSPYDISNSLNNIANIEMANKDFINAKIHLDSAESINNRFGFRENKKDWYQLKSEFYNGTENFSSAVVLLKKHEELKDSLINETRLKRIDFLEERYQSEKKQQSINTLEKEQKMQRLYLRQKTTLNSILIGSLAGVLFLGFLLYRNYRQKQQLQQQRIRELEKDSQLMAVDAMLRGQEEERSRLARDLHDGLGGMLSGVKFSLNNMKDNLIITPDNMAVFERSLDLIDGSIKELRRVAHNMMPEMLTKFGLDEALKEYCNSVNATRLLAVKYQSFGMKERLESPSEIIIYRIIQELLNNILKHASASEALVQIIREDNRLNILVEDNGHGFDTAVLDSNKGAGWMNIRSRVDYLKGRLDIHSEIKKGTSVTIEFNV